MTSLDLPPTIDLLEHLAVLKLEPGDLVVLTCPEYLSPEQGVALRDDFRDQTGIEAVVLSGGLEIGALRMPTA